MMEVMVAAGSEEETAFRILVIISKRIVVIRVLRITLCNLVTNSSTMMTLFTLHFATLTLIQI